MHTHTNMLTHLPTQKHTHLTCSHIHSYLYSDMLTHMNMLMGSLARQHGHTLTHTQTHSHIQPHSHGQIHRFSQAHKHAYIHPHLHTHSYKCDGCECRSVNIYHTYHLHVNKVTHTNTFTYSHNEHAHSHIHTAISSLTFPNTALHTQT